MFDSAAPGKMGIDANSERRRGVSASTAADDAAASCSKADGGMVPAPPRGLAKPLAEVPLPSLPPSVLSCVDLASAVIVTAPANGAQHCMDKVCCVSTKHCMKSQQQ